MADDADRAQSVADAAQEKFERERLARIAASHAPRDSAIDATCADCGGPIEAQRLKTLHFTLRCGSCAALAEQRYRMAR